MPDSSPPLNAEALIHSLCQEYEQRFLNEGIPEADIPVMINFLARMAQVSVQLTQNEAPISVPGSGQMVSFEGPLAETTIRLFSEGLGFALIKTHQQEIPDEVRGDLLQNVAQYVYETSKQVSLSTFGQEDTPEFQIPIEQQAQMVYQTAESALAFFVAEHEKQNGPLNPNGATHQEADPFLTSAMAAPHGLPAMDDAPLAPVEPAPTLIPAAEDPQSTPFPQPLSGSALASHTRLAAVALLLNVLPPAKGQAIWQRFSPEQQQWIHHYQNPAAIEQALDMAAVQTQLSQLRQQLQGSSPTPQSLPASQPPASEPPPTFQPQWHSQLQQWSQQVSLQRVKPFVQQERAAIQECIDVLFAESPHDINLLFQPTSRPSHRPLPQAIQQVLAQHLQRQVGA
jgi:hypothetical protein